MRVLSVEALGTVKGLSSKPPSPRKRVSQYVGELSLTVRLTLAPGYADSLLATIRSGLLIHRVTFGRLHDTKMGRKKKFTAGRLFCCSIRCINFEATSIITLLTVSLPIL